MAAQIVPPSKGRGKVVMGYLIFNFGFTLLLDTRLAYLSWAVVAFGVAWFFYGHLEHYFVKRAFHAGKAMPHTNKGTAAAIGVGLAICLIPGLNAWAAVSATDQIRAVDQTLKRFHKAPKKGQLTATQKKENEQIKSQVLKQDFDMTELCRLSLDSHWKSLSPEKQKEFVRVFTDLLLSNAILHSEKHSGEEKIDYLGEEPIAEFKGRVLVRTKVGVPQESVDFDVDYAMVNDADKKRWRIYDLILDGESLMLNYREQFDQVIRKNSYNYLLERMRKKMREKKEGAAAKGL